MNEDVANCGHTVLMDHSTKLYNQKQQQQYQQWYEVYTLNGASSSQEEKQEKNQKHIVFKMVKVISDSIIRKKCLWPRKIKSY